MLQRERWFILPISKDRAGVANFLEKNLWDVVFTGYGAFGVAWIVAGKVLSPLVDEEEALMFMLS